MHLLVHPNGSKYCRLSYRFDKKQRIFALGVYPSVSLSKARERQGEACKLIAEGIDPNANKKSEATELKAKRDNRRAFKVVAKSWFTTKKKWSEDYQNTVRIRLETYVFPDIGDTYTGIAHIGMKDTSQHWIRDFLLVELFPSNEIHQRDNFVKEYLLKGFMTKTKVFFRGLGRFQELLPLTDKPF